MYNALLLQKNDNFSMMLPITKSTSMPCQCFLFYTLFLMNAIVSVNHINMVFAISVEVFVGVVLKYRRQKQISFPTKPSLTAEYINGTLDRF